MSEYVSRDAVVKWVDDSIEMCGNQYTTEQENMMEMFRTVITDCIPAADVRPVVLCRDCKWYQIDELKKDGTADRRYKPSVCVLAEQRRDPNHFCADGKKREES